MTQRVPKFTVRPSHPAPAGYEDAPPPTEGMEGGPPALAGTKRRGQYLGGPEGGAAAPPQRPTPANAWNVNFNNGNTNANNKTNTNHVRLVRSGA